MTNRVLERRYPINGTRLTPLDDGGIEVVCFPKTFEKVRHVLVCDEPILCTGKVQNEGTAEEAAWKILLENATPIAELRAQKTSRVDIHLNADSVTREQIAELKTILMAAPRGQCQAVVMLAIPARLAASMPWTASSTTAQDAGGTPSRSAASKNT